MNFPYHEEPFCINEKIKINTKNNSWSYDSNVMSV